MGLLSGLVFSFGQSGAGHEVKQRVKEEIDLFTAISAHVSWKVRLQSYMSGNSAEEMDPEVICCDDRCELGKWIHGPGLKHFFADEAFHELRIDHAKFHMVAANVVRHVQANKQADAQQLMDGEYRKISHKLVHTLTELNKHVTSE